MFDNKLGNLSAFNLPTLIIPFEFFAAATSLSVCALLFNSLLQTVNKIKGKQLEKEREKREKRERREREER